MSSLAVRRVRERLFDELPAPGHSVVGLRFVCAGRKEVGGDFVPRI